MKTKKKECSKKKARKRIKELVSLGEFLIEKNNSGILLNDVLASYTVDPLTNEEKGKLKKELVQLARTTTFVIKQVDKL